VESPGGGRGGNDAEGTRRKEGEEREKVDGDGDGDGGQHDKWAALFGGEDAGISRKDWGKTKKAFPPKVNSLLAQKSDFRPMLACFACLHAAKNPSSGDAEENVVAWGKRISIYHRGRRKRGGGEEHSGRIGACGFSAFLSSVVGSSFSTFQVTFRPNLSVRSVKCGCVWILKIRHLSFLLSCSRFHMKGPLE